MPFITRPYCERLGTPFDADLGMGLLSPAAIAAPPAFGRGRAVALYEGPARDLVRRLKFGDHLELAPAMARQMVRAGAELFGGNPLIAPVPLHWTRLWGRRFNQAAELARPIAEETGLAFAPGLLMRTKRTRPQVGLTRAERLANQAGTFAASENARVMLAGRRVIVIDDVRTTGATLNTCAHILRRAGAAEVDVLTFALAGDSLNPSPSNE